MSTKTLLIILSKPPLASSTNQEALDLALAAASFDQPVTLVFEGEGALQLLPDQDENSVGRKNLSKMMKALPVFGIESVYAYCPTLSDEVTTKFIPSPQQLTSTEYADLQQKNSTVIRF